MEHEPQLIYASRAQESNLRKISGRPPVTALVDYQGFCGFSAEEAPSASTSAHDDDDDEQQEEEEEEEGFQRISPQEVVARMEGGWTPFVLDVRWAGRVLSEFCSEVAWRGGDPSSRLSICILSCV